MTALERQMAADAIGLHAAAEARWNRLREHITQERAAQDQLAGDHEESGHGWQTERAYGRVEALDRLLAVMDELEAGR